MRRARILRGVDVVLTLSSDRARKRVGRGVGVDANGVGVVLDDDPDLETSFSYALVRCARTVD
jgi:hypothetical protein